MARFFPLSGPTFPLFRSACGLLGCAALFSLPLPAAPTPPPAPNQAPTATPPPMETDSFSRYGKILELNNQLTYPFKLSMPIPGFGEVKVPSREELDMREKLERLAALSDAQLRVQLEKWPAYGKMSLSDEGAMLIRIQQFRDFRTKMAQKVERQLGLLTLTPDQQARFEKEYWDKRLQLDRKLAQQLEPVIKSTEAKMNEDLFREFSSSAPLARPPKPKPKPAPAPAPVASAAH